MLRTIARYYNGNYEMSSSQISDKTSYESQNFYFHIEMKS